MRALIGSRGVVGQSILAHTDFESVFNRDNLDLLLPNHFESIVIAAPSGSRLMINNSSAQDDQDITQIVTAVQRSKCARVILFSSVDAVVMPNTPYGRNRQRLEHELSDICDITVFRLSTLVGSAIKKNLLYDIKHQQFLNFVNAGAWQQWCLLDDLSRFVDWAQPGQILNIVSEPIQNQDLLRRFCPTQALNFVQHNVNYDLEPWCYTQQQIFEAMEKYLQ